VAQSFDPHWNPPLAIAIGLGVKSITWAKDRLQPHLTLRKSPATGTEDEAIIRTLVLGFSHLEVLPDDEISAGEVRLTMFVPAGME
jgi:hypothetical protein